MAEAETGDGQKGKGLIKAPDNCGCESVADVDARLRNDCPLRRDRTHPACENSSKKRLDRPCQIANTHDGHVHLFRLVRLQPDVEIPKQFLL